jgi:hypothetical protein
VLLRFADTAVVREAAAPTALLVRLAAAPAAAVTVSLTTDCERITVTPSALTFAPGGWDAEQTVLLSAACSGVVEPDAACAVRAGPAVSADPVFDLSEGSATATLANSDVAGVAVSSLTPDTMRPLSATTFFMTEGASGALNLTLLTRPYADVALAVGSSDPSQIALDTGSLSVVAAQWNATHTLGVTAVTSAALTPPSWIDIPLVPSSSDPAYSGGHGDGLARILVLDSTVSNAVQLSPAAGNTSEAGGQTTVYVVLSRVPAVPLLVTLASSRPAEIALSPASLSLDAADYLQPVAVTLTGMDDWVADGTQRVSVSAQWVFAGEAFETAVSLFNTDDDVAGLNASQALLRVNETGTQDMGAFYLTSQPVAPVVLTLTTAAPGSLRVQPHTITIAPADWQTARTFVVTGTVLLADCFFVDV